MAAGNAFVRVLEEDPELAAGLDPTSVQLATRHAIAAVEIVAPGSWEPAVRPTAAPAASACSCSTAC